MIVETKYRGTATYARVLAELIRAAEYQGLTTYQDVALLMGLPTTGSLMGKETGHILGEISEDEVLADRPMLSAVCVNVEGRTGPGFAGLARNLKRLEAGEDEVAFWKRELESVYAAWRRPLPK